MSQTDLLEKIRSAVLEYDEKKVVSLVKDAVDRKIDLMKVLDDGLTKPMAEIGKKFEQGEIFLSEMMLTANACLAGVNLVKPLMLQKKARATLGKILLGTVYGDIHDIGKNIVRILLEVEGFEVVDMGKDQPVDKFVQTAKEIEPDIVASSALLTTSRLQQQLLEDALKKAGMRSKVKTLVGGAAVNEEWREKIGADAYAMDAVLAVHTVKELLGKG